METSNYLKSLFNFVSTYGINDVKSFCKSFEEKFYSKFYELNFESHITNYLYNDTPYSIERDNIHNMVKALWLCTFTRQDIELTDKNVNAYKIYWVRVIKNIVALDVTKLTNSELFYYCIKLFLALLRFSDTIRYIENHTEFETSTFSGMKDVLETETALEISETLLDKYTQDIKMALKISHVQKV